MRVIEAVECGKKELSLHCGILNPRWKYTLHNIVVITDYQSTLVITVYIEAIKLPPVPLQAKDMQVHRELRTMLWRNPSRVTSHHVFVVDRGASMRTCDVVDFKRRIDAVFAGIALGVVECSILADKPKRTEVLTLIEFSNEAAVVIEREPLTNVLYNTIIKRIDTEKPRGKSDYHVALQKVIEVLERDVEHEDLAVSVTFLSDGRPSGIYDVHLCEWYLFDIYYIAFPFHDRMTFVAIGLASNSNDDQSFLALELMSNVARVYGVRASFTAVSMQNSGELIKTLSTFAHQPPPPPRITLSFYESR